MPVAETNKTTWKDVNTEVIAINLRKGDWNFKAI
ncbi:hypothetical protein PTD2_16546 [Pseudoalteromonas tunicata D2]|uniref:Uncharacterized protein n=1 Tax=Pseudoalteromonas tunicata D2 TaxID=87626 RepID=A4CEP3_9GAMM|nr:hypothetical protein PTD2_16546 [Pseudoalteromonas tunicata D2]